MALMASGINISCRIRSRFYVDDGTRQATKLTIQNCTLFLLYSLLMQLKISFHTVNEFFLFGPDRFGLLKILTQLFLLLLQLLALCLHSLQLLISLGLFILLDLLFKVNVQSSLSSEFIFEDLNLV